MSKFKFLSGNILPSKRIEEWNQDDSDFPEEDDEEPQFFDMDEMETVSSGGDHFRKIITPSKEVIIADGGKEDVVTGHFLFTDPWWQVECKVERRVETTYWLCGYQAYTLQTSVGKDIVSLFLRKCNVEAPDFIHQFTDLLGCTPINLANLPQILKKFEMEGCGAASHILPLVKRSEEFAYVNAAFKYPQLMKHLPTLVPWQFKELLRVHKKKNKDPPQQTEASEEPVVDHSLLARLEKTMKKENVWKLGFKYILHQEFNIVGCEATLNAFKECNVFEQIPQLYQDALLLYDSLKRHCWRTKSTYIEMEDLQNSRELQSVDVGEALTILKKNNVVKHVGQKVILQDYHTYETGITKCLQCLIMAEPWLIELNVEEVLQETLGDLDPDQVQAAKMICSNPVTVISGKGGCGKTTLIKLVFQATKHQIWSYQAYEDKHSEEKKVENEGVEKNSDMEKPVVLLSAPTGRAAALLSNGNAFQAYTMHQVLYNFINWRRESSDGASKGWKFSHVQVLVVDEGSLVGVRMLHSLLSLLTKHAKLKKFILLGDVRQLPSIEPGNTLSDLFHSLQKVKWSIDMRTNHRAESELIVENAELISQMGKRRKFENLKFDAIVDLNTSFTMPSTDKKFILFLPKKGIYSGLQDAVKQLLENKAPGLDCHVSSQFVTFQKKDCALINELCCKHYSEHCTKKTNKQILFQPGDKVCCTRNGYVVDKDKENEWCRTERERKDMYDNYEERSVPKERLCNGEIFFINNDRTVETERRTSKRYLELSDYHGRVITTEYKELQRECKLQHAWVRTIHTFQGSEVKTVVYVVGAGNYQTWRHVYTAVTRGRERVYVVAEEGGLKKAIEWREKPRKTRLKELLTPVLQWAAKHKRPSSEDFCGIATKQTRDEKERPCPFAVFTVGEQVLVETYDDDERKWSWSGPHTVTHVIGLAVKVQGRSDFVPNSHVQKYQA